MSDDMDKRIEAFLARPEMSTIEESDLDELVHDAFAGIAAQMNNAGPEAQAQLLREGGFEPDALKDPDETVHSILSTGASVVNNSGLTEQVRVLFQSGMDEASLQEALEIEIQAPDVP